MRLIDADALIEKLEIDSPDPEGVDDWISIINKQPTVCDIEQISSARYNNGFYDGKKAMEEKLEQIKAKIEQLDIYYDNDYFSGNKDPMYKCNEVLQIIDKHRADMRGEKDER